MPRHSCPVCRTCPKVPSGSSSSGIGPSRSQLACLCRCSSPPRPLFRAQYMAGNAPSSAAHKPVAYWHAECRYQDRLRVVSMHRFWSNKQPFSRLSACLLPSGTGLLVQICEAQELPRLRFMALFFRLYEPLRPSDARGPSAASYRLLGQGSRTVQLYLPCPNPHPPGAH